MRASTSICWLVGLLATVACSSSSDDEPEDVTEAPPDQGAGFLVGEDGSLPGNDGTSSGTLDPGTQCLGETHEAERIGLDMFVMLDISGSMLDVLPPVNLLAPPTTKWDAVRQSLESFVQDPATEDIGIGLQYFPLTNDGVPDSCATNEDCNGGGPCTTSICAVDDQIDVGGGAQPLPYVRGTDQFCSTDAECTGAGETCRTLIGTCVFPPGSIAGVAGGAFVNTQLDPTLPPVLALCDSTVDCRGLRPSQCEEVGLCTLTLDACTESVGCPPGAGDCVPFPYQCVNETTCELTPYSTPAVAIGVGPTRAPELVASLEAQVPRGQTPTGPALAGALEQARLWAEQHPDRQVLTVLATDGFPTSCDPLEIPDISAIASDAASAARPVRTFVIGVFSNGDLGDDGQQRLDTIARAGGSDSAFVINTGGNVAEEFLDALNLIRNTAVSCDFQLDGAATLDFDRVNLQVTDASGTATDLLNVGDASACGGGDGWYYVRDPAGTPLQISVCPSTCGTFTGEGVRADLQIGCATRIR